jgi:N-acyl-D-amino-acid deacylase
MLKRFADPALRARIVTETEAAMNARFGGAAGVYLPATKRELVDVAREWNVSPGEAVLRILEERNETGIMRFGSEADLVKILQYPATSMACDCGATLNTRQHPRAWGSFPRVLGRYVREQHVLTWEDAIRKMTALPANTVGMIDRGYLAPGMTADVTIFDPATIVDRATYEDPAQLSEGVRYVLVNGVVAVREGRVTGQRGGQVMARTAHMPSRPMNRATEPRKLSLKGTIAGTTRVAIDVSQPAGAPRAHGSFTVAGDWVSFTAVAHARGSIDREAVSVVVERADPSMPGRPRTVTISLSGGRAVSGTVR